MPTLHLGTLAHLKADPFFSPDALEIIEDGALLVDDQGKIKACGTRTALLAEMPDARVVDYGKAWLIPGLIDGHIHFPQYYATAAYGGQLLDWLFKSILPAETAFADPEFATDTARCFVQHLLSCGTTTALVFGSQFHHANVALFNAAKEFGIRLIAGATLMDSRGEGIPNCLLVSVEQAQAEAESLIAFCDKEPLLHYAVTPRYALSCSVEMMHLCASLLRENPETYLQTHINENHGEIDSVMGYYRGCRDYLEVYENFDLITERTLLAHSIHSSASELDRIAQAGCSVCHCPTSNLYLGSGLFPLSRHIKQGIKVCLGTDIGAGNSFSIWSNLSDAYKIQQLQQNSLDAAQLLYLGTLGGAKALRLESETGNFAIGKNADFFVLKTQQNNYLAERLQRCESLAQQLFCLLHLASETQSVATFVQGKLVWANQKSVN